MPITVIIRSPQGSDACLTFDGMQRVVIGRGASCDVRLPDASVSHRHACLRSNGADLVLVDEGSTNGTFVGQVRIAARTSRVVRSGDLVRVGRVLLELRIDQGPATRDLAGATRDLALALVSRAMAARGEDLTVKVRVVEGADQGTVLPLADEGREYVLGRGAQCDLLLSDRDASREHACVVRQGSVVVARTLGAKNGMWLGESRAPDNGEIVWRPSQMMRIGRTVLALEEPLRDALARIESEPDEAVPAASLEAPDRVASAATLEPLAAAPMADAPSQMAAVASRRPRSRFSIADMAVMATAIGVLALSIAGLVWLLHG